MRSYLTLRSKHRRSPCGGPDIRLLKLNEVQKRIMASCVSEIERAGKSTSEATALVTMAASILTAGAPPTKEGGRVVADLSTCFPARTEEEILALPHYGRPLGRIDEIVIFVAVRDNGSRVVLFGLDYLQAEWFEEAEANLIEQGMNEHYAWSQTKLLASKLIGGGRPKDDAEEIVVRGSRLFSPLRPNRARKLREATEDDIARLEFTEPRP